MPLVAIETSGPLCSVAVGEIGRPRVTRTERVDRRHAARLVPMIGEALAAADVEASALTGVVVGIGPGSFTGVRVALSAAIGLSLAAGCGLAPVNGFDALRRKIRQDGLREQPLLVAIDSLRNDVFAALRGARDEPLMAPAAYRAEALADHVAGILAAQATVIVAGNASDTVAAALAGRGLVPRKIDCGPAIEASWLLAVTGSDEPPLAFDDPSAAKPLYLRAPAAVAG